MLIGVGECTPLLGLGIGFIDRKIQHSTFDKQMQQRELFIKNRVDSSSFSLQELFFDVYSSKLTETIKEEEKNLYQILNNSTPDSQLFSLINDLEDYEANNTHDLSDNQKVILQKCINNLKKAKDLSLLIGSIVCAATIKKKNELNEELKKLLKEQITGMKNGEEILVPCGYMNGNIYNLQGIADKTVVGHSILMKITKHDESYSLSIYNTGEGIYSHQKDGFREDRYYALHYKIDNPAIFNQDEFYHKFTAFGINEDLNKQYESKDVYAFFDENFGKPQKIEIERDKSYKKQISVDNCTKKCLQVWLHDEMKGITSVYKDFRVYRLQKKIASVNKIEANKKFTYIHPLASWGSTKSASLFNRILQGTYAFFVTPQVKLSLSIEDIKGLKEYANTILQKRLDEKIIENNTIKLVTNTFKSMKPSSQQLERAKKFVEQLKHDPQLLEKLKKQFAWEDSDLIEKIQAYG